MCGKGGGSGRDVPNACIRAWLQPPTLYTPLAPTLLPHADPPELPCGRLLWHCRRRGPGGRSSVWCCAGLLRKRQGHCEWWRVGGLCSWLVGTASGWPSAQLLCSWTKASARACPPACLLPVGGTGQRTLRPLHRRIHHQPLVQARKHVRWGAGREASRQGAASCSAGQCCVVPAAAPAGFSLEATARAEPTVEPCGTCHPAHAPTHACPSTLSACPPTLPSHRPAAPGLSYLFSHRGTFNDTAAATEASSTDWGPNQIQVGRVRWSRVVNMQGGGAVQRCRRSCPAAWPQGVPIPKKEPACLPAYLPASLPARPCPALYLPQEEHPSSGVLAIPPPHPNLTHLPHTPHLPA